MRNHSNAKYSLLKSLYLSSTIALSFSILGVSSQVDCSGCTPIFDTIEDTISVSCEITPTPTFPSYTAGCSELNMSEATFVATLGQSSRCEGNNALAIGAGQDLCLTLSGFQNYGLAQSDRFFVGSESLTWTHYANGSATLTGVIYNEASDLDAYDMEVYMEGGFNWTEWNTMGNLVLDALNQGTQEDWIYFILVNNMSKLTGVGVNAGKTIRLTHSPSSEELGFQLGSMGANNINLNHGLGGWVNWEVLDAGNTFGGVGNITIDLTNCVNSEYTCADNNDILYRFYAGNVCGYDQVDILIDHTDNTPPSWTYVPGDLTQECSDTPILENATATDLCSELSISIVSDTLLGSSEGNYIVTRTFTAEDACGNTTSATQTMTIIDTSAPVLTIPADYTAECSDTHPMEDATTTDYCGAVTIDMTETTVNGACAGEYNIIRVFTATDDAGNSISDTQTITILDTTAPVLTIPADYTAECSDTHPMNDATATDNCGTVTISLVETTVAGTCAGAYTVTREFTATDDCGNASSATQTITIVDTTLPEFTSIPADYTAECSDTHPMNDATATDNCGEVTIAVIETTIPGNCAGDYSITRTFTATDECGNANSATQTITIIDTTLPEFTSIPADYTAECSDVHPMDDASATDNCGEVTIAVIETTIPGNCAGDYSITRTFTATDECGNATSATQTITIIDTSAPELTIPAEYTAECSDAHPMDDATAIDNCGEVTIDVVETTTDGACVGEYTITRAFTATDDCGNATSATQTITIIDTTAPELTIPADYTAECSDVHPMDDASATDNCGEVTIDVVETTTDGACVGEYTITRAFTATDDCGNATSATQTITIIDTTAPELTIPADYTAECSDAHPMDDASATDNCGEVTISVVESTIPGNCAGDFSITREFTATDDCGNTTTATQTISIIDTTAPVLTIPADYTAECSDAHPMDDASATDNCGVVTISVVESTIPGNCAGDFSITREFTATDDCGNATTATQTISIIDTTAPVLTIPADYIAECSDAHPMDDASATDNCGEVTISVVESTIPGNCAGNYSITRAFTATDDCGNAVSSTQTITIIDTTAPSLISPENLSLSCLDSIDFGTPTSSDFCSDVDLTIISDTTLGACPAQYLITRTFVATDYCGNSATATQTIEYFDNTPPSFGSTASYIEIACSEEAVLDAEAFDACSAVSELTYIDNFGSGGCMSPTSNIVRVLTAVDACGNSASFEQTIQFIDTVAPIFTYIPSDIAIDCSTDFPSDFPVISDDCSDVNLIYTLDTLSMDAPNNYTVSLLWTATDGCGNEKTATQLISVSDTEAPIFTQAPNLPAFLEIGSPLPTCNTIEWSASDNCYASNKIIFDCTLDTVFTDNGPCIGPYEIHYAYSLSDPSGNTAEFSHVIIMTDLTPPVWISIPENSSASCDDEIIWEEPVANGVDLFWDITIDTIPGVCQYTYELERTMTPVDGCGILGDTYTHSIFVSDDTSPEFIGELSDLSLSCGEEIPLIDISAIDNCTADILVSDSSFISPGSCEGNYMIIHELIAEDLCGNTTTETYTISITDTLAPVFINSPEDLVLELGEEFPACNEADIEIEDNCSSAQWTCEEMIEPGLCLGASSHVRTYTASDACGNESFATQVVMILDTTAPEFTFFPSSFTLPCDGDTLPLMTNSLTGYDLGSPDSLTFSFEGLTTGGDDCNIEKIRVYRVSDDCGNYLDSTHVTLLIDTVAPTLNTPLEDLSFTCLSDLTPCDIDQLDISDNCNTTTSSCIDLNLEGDCDNEPCTIERIYTISDLCGNSLDISQTISITASPSDSLCDTTIAVQEPAMFTSHEPSCIPYPNPIRASSQGGSINLLNCPDMTEWVILNSLGKVVAHGQSSTIQVTNLTQGLYFLRANGYGTQRIVVLK